jgi:hypothetical protein
LWVLGSVCLCWFSTGLCAEFEGNLSLLWPLLDSRQKASTACLIVWKRTSSHSPSWLIWGLNSTSCSRIRTGRSSWHCLPRGSTANT